MTKTLIMYSPNGPPSLKKPHNLKLLSALMYAPKMAGGEKGKKERVTYERIPYKAQTMPVHQ
jgi:hypothetical protein